MEHAKTAERIAYLDILKGFAVFLVVWGHTLQNGGREMDLFENKMFIFIYSFHMPLFLLISGYLFAKSVKRRSLLINLKNKLMHLAIPAVIWGCLFCIIKWVLEKILGNTVELSIRVCIQEIGKIWFVWTVLLCMLVVMLAETMKKRCNEKMFIPMLLWGMVILYLLPYREYTLYLFPFFIAGYYAEGYYTDDNYAKSCNGGSVRNVYWAALFLFPIMLQNYQSRHFIYVSGMDIFHSEYGWGQQLCIDLFRWAIGFAGCIVVFIAVRLFTENIPNSRIAKVLGAVGNYSLEIYLMQRILVEYLGNKFMWKFVHYKYLRFLQQEYIYNYLFTPLCAIAFTTILFYTAKILGEFGKQLRTKLYGA